MLLKSYGYEWRNKERTEKAKSIEYASNVSDKGQQVVRFTIIRLQVHIASNNYSEKLILSVRIWLSWILIPCRVSNSAISIILEFSCNFSTDVDKLGRIADYFVTYELLHPNWYVLRRLILKNGRKLFNRVFSEMYGVKFLIIDVQKHVKRT